MSGNCFVDTNILIYARDASSGSKQSQAEALLVTLWEERRGRISVQVLNEYYVTVTQKLKPGLPRAAAWKDLEAFHAWGPVPLDWRLVERAHHLGQQHGLSWWDALVVAAAQSGDCETLYSEELADGQRYGAVRVVNPFR